jgi:hypothetical protein
MLYPKWPPNPAAPSPIGEGKLNAVNCVPNWKRGIVVWAFAEETEKDRIATRTLRQDSFTPHLFKEGLDGCEARLFPEFSWDVKTLRSWFGVQVMENADKCRCSSTEI